MFCFISVPSSSVLSSSSLFWSWRQYFPIWSTSSLFSLSKTFSGMYCLMIISIFLTVTANKFTNTSMYLPEIEVNFCLVSYDDCIFLLGQCYHALLISCILLLPPLPPPPSCPPPNIPCTCQITWQCLSSPGSFRVWSWFLHLSPS